MSLVERFSPAEERRLHGMLVAELSAAGCFRRAPLHSIAYGAFILATYAVAYGVLLADPGLAARGLAIVVIAALCMHGGFLSHEAGHGALTSNRRLATAVGLVFNTLVSGMCYAYFQHIHRKHHPHCNQRAHDPDMQSELFTLYPESARDKRWFGRLITRHQAWLIWILVWLQGLTLKIDSLILLARNWRTTRAEQAVLALHVALWLVVPALVLGIGDAWLNYSLITLLIGGYTGAAFLVNHVGTRVIEPDERHSHFLREIEVTRNLGTSRIADFFFGGLNNHVEHHVFPSMPTARLRAARDITRAFCRRHGIDYKEMSWTQAAREVTAHFKAMSALVRS
jgi:fatty acid desaturase